MEHTGVNDLLAAFDEADKDGDGTLDLKKEVKDWLPMSPEANSKTILSMRSRGAPTCSIL